MTKTVKFKRTETNPDLPLPSYATAGAAAMDLRACLPEGDVSVEPGSLVMVPIGFCVELPQGTEMQIRARSGMALKRRLMIPNAPGTIDSDYRGEVIVGLFNYGAEAVTLAHGDRIAQAVVADVLQVACTEVTELSDTARGSGGFGSTGVS
ncbi:dUTP diphosphatase [Cognatishimia sp.]|uniref:dUTP diphosphatase n=1 Tax=Cognatishimia sp. TaxID=2211648 RepID=UPI003515FAF3